MNAEPSTSLYQALLDALGPAVVVIGADGTITYATPNVVELIGRPADEVVGTNIVDYAAGDLEEAASALTYARGYDGVMGPMPFRYRAADGRTRVAIVHSRGRFDDPDVGGLVLTISDNTGQALFEDALRSLAADRPTSVTFDLLTTSLSEPPFLGMCWLISAGEPPTLQSASDNTSDALIELLDDPSAPWHRAIEQERAVDLADLSTLSPELRKAAEAEGMSSVSVHPVPLADGGMTDCFLVAWRRRPGPATDNQRGQIARTVDLAAIVLQRDERMRRLRHRASFDSLTGIANRDSFLRAIRDGRGSGHAAHLEAKPVHDVEASEVAVPRDAVLFLDLDEFKAVNDQWGHQGGDQVLTEVARRIVEGTRPDDLVARLGGDEFAVLCRGLRDETEATLIAQRILERISIPIAIQTRDEATVQVKVGTSIGIAFAAPGSPPSARLIDAADRALYRVKASGQSGWLVASSPAVPGQKGTGELAG